MGINDVGEQLQAAKEYAADVDRKLVAAQQRITDLEAQAEVQRKNFEWLHAKEGRAGSLALKLEAERDTLASELVAAKATRDAYGDEIDVLHIRITDLDARQAGAYHSSEAWSALIAERDALAAQIDAIRTAFRKRTDWGDFGHDAWLIVCSTAADLVADVKAEAWASGALAGRAKNAPDGLGELLMQNPHLRRVEPEPRRTEGEHPKWRCLKCEREVHFGYDDGQIPEHHRTCPKRVLMTHPHDGHGPDDTCFDCEQGEQA